MTFARNLLKVLPAILGGLALAALMPGTAEAAATVNKGDTAWMLIATCMVVLMTVPGLALFYGGLVRTKNVLSVLMHVLIVFCVIAIRYAHVKTNVSFTRFDNFDLGSMPTWMWVIWAFLIIYAVTNGFLDDVAVKDLKAWERGFHDFMATKYPQVGSGIRTEKALSKDGESALRHGIEEYKKMQAK